MSEEYPFPCYKCGVDVGNMNNAVELVMHGKNVDCCPSCAEGLFRADELAKARQYTIDCQKREDNINLVIASTISLATEKDKICPNCQMHISMPDGILGVAMDIDCESGNVCTLCGFHIPMLPDLIYAPDGNLWK